jgi:CHAT domain-containing protein
VIVAAPRPPAALRRRYPELGSIEQSMSEARAVAAALPGSYLLNHEQATKTALLDLWEEAPYVYAATHFIRDPELPYLTFLPLSQPAGVLEIEQSYVDIDDIRSADLSRCRLVVLSGCASGAPYVTAGRTSPGLGDALIDAGAAAVVDTFWRVRDDAAARLMGGFIRVWAGEGRAPEQALGIARREFLEGPAGVRHPFTWAAYAVTLGRL